MDAIVSLSAGCPSATRVTNVEESSNVSDKSYCVEAIMSFEGDDEPCQQTKSLNQSHDSEITQLVSNTAAALAEVKAEKVSASSAAASTRRSTLAEFQAIGHHSLSALASLLEQAASLTTETHGGSIGRSNSFDSKQRSPTLLTVESNKTMYASAPNLDFFNAFDQDPHLSDTESAEHRGSWWDDSEHTQKIVAALSKDFSKSYKASPAKAHRTFQSSMLCSPDFQESEPDKATPSVPSVSTGDKIATSVPSTSTECASPHSKQESWANEEDSSSERLSHSLVSIRKESDQSRLKSDGTVKTNSTDMAVTLPRSSASTLADKLSLRDSEADTVATSATRTVTSSRDSAQSLIIMTPSPKRLSVSPSPGTTNSAIATRKSPRNAVARHTKPVVRVCGQDITTPVASNKKKKVIKVRASNLDGEEKIMDPAKVQEAFKGWKSVQKLHVEMSNTEASPATPGSSAKSPVKRRTGMSKTHSLSMDGAVSVTSADLPSTRDGSRRSQRVCQAALLAEASLSSGQSRRPDNEAVSKQLTSARSESHRRERHGSGSASSNPRPRSKSAGRLRPPQDCDCQKPMGPESTPSMSQRKSGVSSNLPATKVQKRLAAKTVSSGRITAAMQSVSYSPSPATPIEIPNRGRSRASNSTPMSDTRSLSLGQRIKVSPPTSIKECSTRSTTSGVLAGDTTRTRSRSLGKLGSALFRRKPLENEAAAVAANPKERSTGLFAVFTQAVSRTPRSAQPEGATTPTLTRSKSLTRLKHIEPSTRSKSLPRMQQTDEKNSQLDLPSAPPTVPDLGTSNTTSKPPPQTRRALRNVSTRAICPAPPRSPSDTTYSPRKQRRIPPQDYIPSSIELSPNSPSSSFENDYQSVIYGPASAEAEKSSAVDRRQLLERAVSELSDDALFRRIRSAGVTDEMMSKLGGMGLIITEATPSLVGRIVEGPATRV